MGTDHKHRVCTFHEAEAAIKANEKIYINDCFCRTPARDGKTPYDYCGHTIETCMGFYPPSGDDPQYSAREISREEALGLFDDWKKQGHFFRFMEDERWICFCCACGCGFFRDKNGRLVEDSCDKSLHIELTDADECSDCGECIDPCAYDARTLEDGALKITRENCYGCSACEYFCTENAITMIPRQ